MKKILALALVCILCLSLLVACSSDNGSGEKAKATIILVDKDEKEYKYEIEFTDGSSLRDALHEAGLIDDDEYSAMFIQNIDGHIANTLEDGYTWLPQDTDRNQIMGTYDEITLKSGDTIYLQYYLVPDMD